VGGWWDLKAGHAEKYGFKGGGREKILGVKVEGGPPPPKEFFQVL